MPKAIFNELCEDGVRPFAVAEEGTIGQETKESVREEGKVRFKVRGVS